MKTQLILILGLSSILSFSNSANAAATLTFSGTVSSLSASGTNKQALLDKYSGVLAVGTTFQYEALVDETRSGYEIYNNNYYVQGSYYAELLSTNIALPSGLLTDAYQEHYANTVAYEIPSPGVWPKEQELVSSLSVGEGITFGVSKSTYCYYCTVDTHSFWPDYRIEYWSIGNTFYLNGAIRDQLGTIYFSAANTVLTGINGNLPLPNIPIPSTIWSFASSILGLCGLKLRKSHRDQV